MIYILFSDLFFKSNKLVYKNGLSKCSEKQYGPDVILEFTKSSQTLLVEKTQSLISISNFSRSVFFFVYVFLFCVAQSVLFFDLCQYAVCRWRCVFIDMLQTCVWQLSTDWTACSLSLWTPTLLWHHLQVCPLTSYQWHHCSIITCMYSLSSCHFLNYSVDSAFNLVKV